MPTYPKINGFSKADLDRVVAKASAVADNAIELKWDKLKLATNIEAVIIDEIRAVSSSASEVKDG